jgi:hypothetical protein
VNLGIAPVTDLFSQSIINVSSKYTWRCAGASKSYLGNDPRGRATNGWP